MYLMLFMCGSLTLSGKARIFFYTVFSYVFYAASFPPYILLLLTSSIVDFYTGKKLDKTEQLWKRKALLSLSLTINLGLLASFKYLDFFIELWNGLLSSLNVSWQLPQPHLLLPIGISFYTFQTLSYSLDIYRKQLKPTDSFLEFACFVSFFPQLVAGPIVRAKEFLPQIAKAIPLVSTATIIGVELILVGLFKKTTVADNLAPMVETIFNQPSEASGSLLWWGSFLFAIQIYADFSGYTDIARGLARMLGFEFPVNFQWPYLSQSIQQFWRRWHMTLSFWIRDYLYFSLGGSRVAPLRFALNMLLTWTLMGLWHGASLTFVVWGLYHGLWLIMARWLKSMASVEALLNQIPSPLKILFTFVGVVFGWAAFRAESLYDLIHIWQKMLSQPFGAVALSKEIVLAMSALILIHLISYKKQYTPEEKSLLKHISYPVRLSFVSMMLVMLIIWAGSTQSFIYFAF